MGPHPRRLPWGRQTPNVGRFPRRRPSTARAGGWALRAARDASTPQGDVLSQDGHRGSAGGRGPLASEVCTASPTAVPSDRMCPLLLMPRTRRLAVGAAITAATALLLPGQAHAAGALRISKIWYDSPGSDTGTNASLNGEWVQITNSTGTAVSLKGWTLTDASRHAYTFPAFTLARQDRHRQDRTRHEHHHHALPAARRLRLEQRQGHRHPPPRQRHPPPHLRLQLHPLRLQNLLNQTARRKRRLPDGSSFSRAERPGPADTRDGRPSVDGGQLHGLQPPNRTSSARVCSMFSPRAAATASGCCARASGRAALSAAVGDCAVRVPSPSRASAERAHTAMKRLRSRDFC
ncbi:lamin tail domain-containing protein [Streptomyces sp. MT206]|uniref:lamin tail domain-containing protein n=1 Tax=Streptomyces sp. MT206 TaxID=3031407 RepID=UPI003FA68743